MLLPALSKARNKAKGIQCASQLKQMGNGVQFFVDENDGRYFPVRGYLHSFSYVAGNPYVWWHGYVAHKLGWKGNISDVQSKLFDCPMDPKLNNRPPRTYEGGGGPNNGDYQSYGYNYVPFADTAMKLGHIQKSRISDPSRVFVIGDSSDSDAVMAGTLGSIYVRYADHPVGTRHKKGLNLLYVDGHVDNRKHAEVQSSTNLWYW